MICSHRRLPRFVFPALALVLVLVVTVTDVPRAEALWSASTAPGGAGKTTARMMSPGSQPAASTRPANGDSVGVSWGQSTGGVVEGYGVRAYDAVTGEERAVGGTCTGLVTSTSCTDSDVPDGQWVYSSTPRTGAWAGTESDPSLATWVDTVAPTVEMAFPQPGGAYGETAWNAGCSTPGACGTGDDVDSGLVSGGLTVQQANSGLYWDGSSFASPVEVLLQVTGGTPGFNIWDYPISNFPEDGVYTIAATATDAVGNTTTDSATFTIDRDGPATPTGFPIDGGVYNADLWHAGCAQEGFCGSPGDVGGEPVIAAEVSVRQGSGLYWDGSAFSSNSEVLIPVTDPAGFAFPVANFPADGFYTTSVVLTDLANNVTRASVIYRIDRIAPTLTAGFPLPGDTYNAAVWDAGCAEPGICGGGQDESGALASAAVSIRQVGTGLYWDGSAFGTYVEQLIPATTEVFAFPAANFPADGQYAIRGVVRDQAGNTASLTATITIDNAPPTLTGGFPVPGGSYNAAEWNAGCTTPGFCGSSTDPGGVASLRISLRQDATGNYWDGTGFTSATETFISIVNDEVVSFPATNFPADGSYTGRIEATDFAGNATSAGFAFTLDRTTPTVSLTFPANGGSYTTASWNTGCPTSGFCGSVADPGGSVSGQVSIRQGTGNYWNGTAFASATETFEPFTTAGGLPFPVTNFAADGTYTAHLVAIDAPGNTAETTATFTIDRTPPTAALTFPVNAGTYNSAGWNAGCSTAGICGTISDATGLTSGQVSIRQGTGNYWNGTAFASATETFEPFTTAGGLPFPVTNFAADGSYTVRLVATDSSGNTASTSSTFAIDRPESGYRSLVVSDGPAAYWRLGESSGTTAVDEMGTSNGTYAAGSTLGRPGAMIGDPNTAVALNGSTGRIAVPAEAAGTNITGNLSVEAWIKPTATQPGFARVASRYSGTNVQFMLAYDTAGKNMRFLLDVTSGRVTAFSGADLRDGLWHHLVGTWDGSTARLYIDGVQAASSTGSGAVLLANTTTMIGSDATGSPSYFSGVVDETALYDDALTPAQILTHYQRGSLHRPTAAVTFPVQGARYTTTSWNAGCSATICGTAADPDGSVASVALSIRRDSTGLFWNGSSFASTTPVLLHATGTTNWTLPFAASAFPATGTYIATVTTTDNNGNTGGVTRSFVIT